MKNFLVKMSCFKYSMLFIVFFIWCGQSMAQNRKMIIRSMSCKNKVWAIRNVSSLKKALVISNEVLNTMDSLYRENLFETNSEGSRLDAFRHIYWMYSLASEIGIEKSRRIGLIYEDYNQYVFSVRSCSGYDFAGRLMDEYNNELGLYLFSKMRVREKEEVFEEIMNLISRGCARIVAKDKLQRSLDVNDNVIPESEWKSQWNNNRCLIKSNKVICE